VLRFKRDLSIIRSTDYRFYRYLKENWLHILRKWACHAQDGLVHFGNLTNNRTENANGRLKHVLNARDRLSHAVHKVWNFSEQLLKEWEMHASFQCDRRELFNVDAYVQDVLHRMTTYASRLVMNHLKGHTVSLSYHEAEEQVS
jgi:hypothetical protein